MAPLTREDYAVRGSTALLDAIGKTIHKIREAQRSTKEEYRAEKVIFIIITDGQENASHRYTADMIRQRIEHQKKKYGWEFLFFGANMDAIAEAGKIGIGADRAQNYCADSSGTQTTYTAMSAMSTAFRIGKPLDFMDMGDTGTGGGQQVLNKVFKSLKSADGGLKRSADQLRKDAEELFQVSKANGGKIPDVNEILKKVLDEEQERHTERYDKNSVSESDSELLGKRWKGDDTMSKYTWQEFEALKYPYRTGLIETPFNPCPQCKLNGYQTYGQFKKQSIGDSTIDERRS